ncbi:MAG: hypothetical protein U0872_09595 [Planctomycetaceae bacterium]
MSNNRLARRSAQSSQAWIRYFEQQANSLKPLPWTLGSRLTAEERRKVLPSIAIFQLGESGEGRHLFRAAEDWATASGDQDYVIALRMFIEEEHRHAQLLGDYLDLAEFPRLKTNWTDGLFRWLRHLAGLQLSITVLLSAELIAMVYYAALRRASGCPLLMAICRQVLEDECAHLRFQAQQIGRLRRERTDFERLICEAFHAGLLAAISVVVWSTHRQVFRAARLTFVGYQQKLWGQYRAALAIMRSACKVTEEDVAPVRLCPV